jgi:hypothetical protein
VLHSRKILGGILGMNLHIQYKPDTPFEEQWCHLFNVTIGTLSTESGHTRILVFNIKGRIKTVLREIFGPKRDEMDKTAL